MSESGQSVRFCCREGGRTQLPLTGWLHVRVDQQAAWLERLDALALSHIEAAGYEIEGSTAKAGWCTHLIHVPEKDGVVRLSVSLEVFALSFPGGYSWAEFAYEDPDREEALSDLLSFLDAYASPDTAEARVPRRLFPDRKELRISNGAVLRSRGWSSGPPA